MKKYLQYKAKVAETLAEVFLKRTGHVVVRTGGEEVLSTLFDSGVIESAMITGNSPAKGVMAHLMKQFDFTVFAVADGKIDSAFLLDVKCWDFSDFKEDVLSGRMIGGKAFVNHTINDTSLAEQAKKYTNVHKNAGLLIFATVKEKGKSKIIILYETIGNILTISTKGQCNISEIAWKKDGDPTRINKPYYKIRRLKEHRWTKSKPIVEELERLEKEAQMLCPKENN